VRLEVGEGDTHDDVSSLCLVRGCQELEEALSWRIRYTDSILRGQVVRIVGWIFG